MSQRRLLTHSRLHNIGHQYQIRLWHIQEHKLVQMICYKTIKGEHLLPSFFYDLIYILTFHSLTLPLSYTPFRFFMDNIHFDFFTRSHLSSHSLSQIQSALPLFQYAPSTGTMYIVQTTILAWCASVFDPTRFASFAPWSVRRRISYICCRRT